MIVRTQYRLQFVWFLLAMVAMLAASDARAATRGFIANAVPPQNNAEIMQAAIDLNGDGVLDNQLAQVLAQFSGLGVDLSAPVVAGRVVYLLRVTSSDPNFQNAAQVRAEWIVGQPTAPVPPDFSGSGSFLLDGNHGPGAFVAPLVATNYVSAEPATTTAPVDVPLQLMLGDRFVVMLHGARLKFTITPGGLVSGQLNGSITQEDIQIVLIPAFATLLNQIVAAGGPNATTVRQIFDNGCGGFGAGDGLIDTCEVNNSILGTMLAPDLDLYDASGAYAPNPAPNPTNNERDSLSFGMRFTAANATVPLEVVHANSFE